MLLKRQLWIGIAAALEIATRPALAETFQVTIDKLVFSPANVNATVGDTIEWFNKDILVHTATVKGGWDVMIPAGKSTRLVLDKVESADYYCRFHPNMKGKVTVTEP